MLKPSKRTIWIVDSMFFTPVLIVLFIYNLSVVESPLKFDIYVYIILNATMVFGSAVLGYQQFCQIKTVLDEEKITRLRLFGSRSLYWKDLREIRSSPYSIQLYFSTGKLVITTPLFLNASECLSFIEDRVVQSGKKLVKGA